MKSVLRLLAASAALFLVLSPSVLAAPLAQDESSTSADADLSDGHDANAVAGKFGEPECESLALEAVCITSNANGYCSHDGYKVLKPDLVEKCKFPRCWCR